MRLHRTLKENHGHHIKEIRQRACDHSVGRVAKGDPAILHSSNIMIQNGEPVIIDMGNLSIGSYLFDVGLVYANYGVKKLGLSMRATS